MDLKRQPQRSEQELAQQEQTKNGTANEEAIESLREKAQQARKEGANVDPSMKIPEEARTPKERLATAIEGPTPDQPPGVPRREAHALRRRGVQGSESKRKAREGVD